MDTDNQRALLESTVSEQYDVLQLLGRDALGSIYLARERLPERFVAIKVLRSELVRGDMRDRCIMEARAAATLTHPHIVRLHAVGDVGHTLCYITDFVDGESLEDQLERSGPLGADDARRALADLADALDYAHRTGVMHGHIEPSDILFGHPSGRAMLTGFGVANERDVDARTDIHALGMIGCLMMTGRLPIEGQPIPDMPTDLGSVVMRCIEKHPARRWSTAATLQRALVARADDPPLPVRSGLMMFAPPRGWQGWWPESLRHPVDVWSKLPKEIRRARTVSTCTYVGVLAVAALLLVGWFQLLTTGTFATTIGFLISAVGGVAAIGRVATKRTTSGVEALLRRKGVPNLTAHMVLAEPTVGSSFWSSHGLLESPASRETSTDTRNGAL